MYEKITLNNSLRIVYEHIPSVRSAALGIWVGSGSRYEKPSENGASHFIEHMVFKGTATRSAAELANLMDEVGGQYNAFTTKECTCFYGRVLDTHLGALLDVLSDMFFRSKFDESDVVNERGVILEEIDMYEDSPEDLVTERLSSAVFRGSPLAYPILGKKATLEKMTGASLKTYMQCHYLPENTVIALSGSFQDSDIEAVKETFSAMPVCKPGKSGKKAEPTYQPIYLVRRKKIEQNHLCLAFPGISIGHSDRYTMQILSGILGGGMSSRLFQTVREDRGLCYNIYSFGSGYLDTGIFGIYSAQGSETESETLRVVIEEIKRFKDGGVTPEELKRTREQIKANVLMNLESTNARMNRLGKNELFLGKIPDPDEMIARYDEVTEEDVRSLANRCLDFKSLSLSSVGKTQTAEAYQELVENTVG